MTTPERFRGFAPAEPPDALRGRVLALGSLPAPPARRWTDAWPFAAAALVIVATILADRAVDASLAAAARGAVRPAPASLQPYDPSAALPLAPDSWASLRPAEVLP